jgi:hypothetical protein
VKYEISCPWADEHTHGREVAYVGQYEDGATWFNCYHAHCSERKWREFREKTVGARPLPEEFTVRSGSQKEEKRNQADRLIQYALDSGAELFVDHLGEPHALVTGTQAVALNSRSYPWLREMMWNKEQRSITAEALKTAAGILAAFALSSGNVRTLYTRSAFYEGKVYYWLGPERVLEVDSEGWRVRGEAPVLFRTIPNLRELPNPSAKGSWDGLEALVNLKKERDKRLFRAYLVTLPLEHIPRPIFQPTGVMDSGKSTPCRGIKRLLDPAAPESVRIDPREFLQKASHSYVVMLDNQNSLPEWAVDTLCRLVTGEADSKRKHYTNDEDFIYELKRGEGAGHLLERLVGKHLHLPGDVGVHGLYALRHHNGAVLWGDRAKGSQNLQRPNKVQQRKTRVQHEGDRLLVLSFGWHLGSSPLLSVRA